MKYLKKWQIPSENDENKTYTVSLTDKNTFACSCPVWIFRRQECKHIARVKRAVENNEDISEIKLNPLHIVFANVKEVTLKENNEVYVPLLPLSNAHTTHFLATIIYDLLKLGFTFCSLAERYDLPKEWTKQKVINYVEARGRYIIKEKAKGVFQDDTYEIKPIQKETIIKN